MPEPLNASINHRTPVTMINNPVHTLPSSGSGTINPRPMMTNNTARNNFAKFMLQSYHKATKWLRSPDQISSSGKLDSPKLNGVSP